jgi:5'-3' exonuclease
MHKVLLIDGNPLIWAAAYSGPMEHVSGGFLSTLSNYLEHHKPQEVIVCWDRGKSRWRISLYPDYKAHRAQRNKDSGIDMAGMEEQSFFVRRFLDAVGIRQVWSEGVEADDMLAWLAEYFTKIRGDCQVVIATGDRDLWQLITDDVKVFDLSRKVMVDATAAEEFFGVPPHKIPMLKALSGDTSDNLPGISKIGDKTAASLLDQYGDLSGILRLENAKELAKKKATSRILPSGDFLGEMYRLVKIPSLKDAYFTLNEEEYLKLKEKLLYTPARDTFQMQLLGGTLGMKFGGFLQHLPTISTPLRGMVDYMQGSLMELGDVCHMCSAGPFDYLGTAGTVLSGVVHPDFLVVCPSGGDLSLYSPEGKLLYETLAALDIETSECRFTGVCMCCVQFPEYGQIMACKTALGNVLSIFQPKMVIALGTVPMMMFTEHTSHAEKYSGVIKESINGLVGTGDCRVAILPNLSDAIRAESCKVDFDYGVSVIRKYLDEVTHVRRGSDSGENAAE